MLYELILINEIEQRAKIIFLSAAKNETVIIYSSSYHSKPEWVSFLYGTERKDILRKVGNQTVSNPIEFHRLP